jgi:molybdopterin converting factor small subunit
MTVVSAVYFGKLRELLGVKGEKLFVDEGATVMDLLVNFVPKRHPGASVIWLVTVFRKVKGEAAQDAEGALVLGDYIVTLNGRTSNLGERLKEGDEVAVMPPFGGG